MFRFNATGRVALVVLLAFASTVRAEEPALTLREALSRTLQSNPDISFIVGNAQAAVSAVQAVREAGLEDQIKIMAFHQNPPVYDLIATGDLLGAANDHTVIQGRMAVDMAVRLLEGQTLEPSNRAGPVITMMTPDNLKTEFVWESTFAPKDYKPEFTVGK